MASSSVGWAEVPPAERVERDPQTAARDKVFSRLQPFKVPIKEPGVEGIPRTDGIHNLEFEGGNMGATFTPASQCPSGAEFHSDGPAFPAECIYG